jgi:hypothetical protein
MFGLNGALTIHFQELMPSQEVQTPHELSDILDMATDVAGLIRRER